MIRRVALALALGTLVVGAAHAVEPGEMLQDPSLEARARTVSEGLRCLVCQNESIDESHAELARDIRLLVRQRILAGDTDQQVRDYMVARYGQFILLRPPFELQTALLWTTPLIVLTLGGVAMFVALRRPPRTMSEGLTREEQARVADLIEGRDRAL
jgi:cytochrome c-type biogenesis protein CcmH